MTKYCASCWLRISGVKREDQTDNHIYIENIRQIISMNNIYSYWHCKVTLVALQSAHTGWNLFLGPAIKTNIIKNLVFGPPDWAWWVWPPAHHGSHTGSGLRPTLRFRLRSTQVWIPACGSRTKNQCLVSGTWLMVEWLYTRVWLPALVARDPRDYDVRRSNNKSKHCLSFHIISIMFMFISFPCSLNFIFASISCHFISSHLISFHFF